ncbi:MAG: rhomboid family intramembrane serine protease [Cyanobacteriota bacterium]|nr:rhomboid family intramembrane serine protease [Cyanobacteriota bacterium]
MKPGLRFYPWASGGLILANLAFFLATTLEGGADNAETLEKLGALSTGLWTRGEWWRALSANFLHFGWPHLGINLLALGIIGTLAERYYGFWKFCFLYFGAGVGTMVGMGTWFWLTGQHQHLLVGASAAIIGALGGLIWIYFRQWQAYPSAYYRNRLWGLGVIIAFQFLLDSQMPQVSLESHALGLALGLLLGAALRS